MARYTRIRKKRQDTPYQVLDNYHNSLGFSQIGKAEVHCAWLPRQSAWGQYDQRQAGVLRVCLWFHKPSGYKIASAEMKLDFGRISEEKKECRPPMVERVYPSMMCGPPIIQKSTHDTSVMPQAEVSGFVSLGGVGATSKHDDEIARRWILTACKSLSDVSSGMYSRVLWTWKANEHNRQDELKRETVTGIVVFHWDQPFRAQMNIDAKLAQGFHRFFMRCVESQPRQFNPPTGSIEDLSSLIGGLEAAIEAENMKRILEYEPGLSSQTSQPVPSS